MRLEWSIQTKFYIPSNTGLEYADDDCLPRQNWIPMERLRDTPRPFGMNNQSNQDYCVGRACGYVPFLSIWSGLTQLPMKIYDCATQVWRGTIKNEMECKVYINNAEDPTKPESHIYKVDLSSIQRVAILALAIVEIVREIISFFGFGLIFSPFDYIADNCCNWKNYPFDPLAPSPSDN